MLGVAGRLRESRRPDRQENAMNPPNRPEPIFDPQELEPLLIRRQHAGDVEAMVALFEPEAVIDCGGGRFVRGHEAIRAFYRELVASGRKFTMGQQRPALISGDLALTSTRLPDGDITSEVARRQADGSWLWVIDRYSVQWG
jgi:hypothetical protein